MRKVWPSLLPCSTDIRNNPRCTKSISEYRPNVSNHMPYFLHNCNFQSPYCILLYPDHIQAWSKNMHHHQYLSTARCSPLSLVQCLHRRVRFNLQNLIGELLSHGTYFLHSEDEAVLCECMYACRRARVGWRGGVGTPLAGYDIVQDSR